MVINKVQLMGHLGQEPIIKTFDSGFIMASLTIATDESYTTATGKKVDNTQWHRLVAWGDIATRIQHELKKGAKVSIEGKLSQRSYNAKDGSKKYVTEIIVNHFETVINRKPNNE